MNFKLFTKRTTWLLSNKLLIKYSKAILLVLSFSHKYCNSGPIFKTLANRAGVSTFPSNAFLSPGTLPSFIIFQVAKLSLDRKETVLAY